MPKSVLKSRYAYRDKNHARRKTDASVEAKPKARLCISGQLDPDLGRRDMAVDAPTASRYSVLLALQLAVNRGWSASIGDIRAAFLNGMPAPRDLYFEQPRRGIPGLLPGQLIAIVKGVFGLATSPKLWWMKLSSELNELSVEDGHQHYKLQQNIVDPCVFHIVGSDDNKVHGLLLTHVDDLLLLAETSLRRRLQDALVARFPIDKWSENSFEYLGCQYEVGPDKVVVSQESYAANRVEKVNMHPDQKDDQPATREQVEENRTAIGSLSWLAKQTRPDLQFNVCCGQRRQNAPTIADLKATNKAVDHKPKRAKTGHWFSGSCQKTHWRSTSIMTQPGEMSRILIRKMATSAGWENILWLRNWATWCSSPRLAPRGAMTPSSAWWTGGAKLAPECVEAPSLVKRWPAGRAWKLGFSCGACISRWHTGALCRRKKRQSTWTFTCSRIASRSTTTSTGRAPRRPRRTSG